MHSQDEDPGKGISQTLKAVLRLRELLLNGEFRPGERVSEIPLAARLEVSRTPLRLALSRLEHEGLLQMLPGGGFIVREFSLADIYDAIEVRGVLEGTAARFAAERLTGRSELREIQACSNGIEAILRDSVTPDSFAAYVRLNKLFHAMLIDLAGSPVLKRLVESVLALPFASPSAFVRKEVELPEAGRILLLAQQQHADILEAIEQHEGTRAEALAREHSRLARRNLQLALSAKDALQRIPGASLIRLPYAV